MKNATCSRRAFAVTLAGLAQASAQGKPLTARQVIERIQKQVGVPWLEQTVDTFKDGDPDTPVTAIATTMMATYEVLEKAAAARANLIITHEPVFYGHLDSLAPLERLNDKLVAAKRALIRRHGLVVWRFHDHWHMRRPDGVQAGMIRALGWEKYRAGASDNLFVVPETTLAAFASAVKQRMGIRTIRVIGDPSMKLTKVGLSPGAPGFMAHRRMLERDDVEVLVIGEGTEWETMQYGADAAAAWKNKALLVLGHIPSEQAGMEECATWLKGFVTEVPVHFIPASEFFWSPK